MSASKEIFDVKYKYFNGEDWVNCSDRVIASSKSEAAELVKAEPSCPQEYKDTVCVTVCSPFRMQAMALKLP